MKIQRDPKANKAKDNARQRKICANSSDKASRKNAPRIKASANRAVRRADKIKMAREGECLEESANTLALKHRSKAQHWGSLNAAEVRNYRDKERAFLDATADSEIKGRQRSRFAKDL